MSDKEVSLQEIADRIAYKYLDRTVASSNLTADIVSALRNERERCAVIAETCHPQPCICQTCLIRAEAGAAIRRTIREGK